MVDATDLIIITSVVQTIAITLTLIVFIFQFRSQEKALNESSYQNAMGRYTDYVRMLVEKPELTNLLNVMGSPNQATRGSSSDKLSPEDAAVFGLPLARLWDNRKKCISFTARSG